MKLMLTVAGAFAILMGSIWFLQGINILPGSFMTGHVQWAVYGAILALVGIGVIIWARRKPAA